MKSILDNKFIFSIDRKYRIARHFLFWFVYWIHYGFLHSANPFGKEEIMYFNNLPYTLTESLLYIIPQMIMTYPILYFILPKFLLNKKYLNGILMTAVLWLIVGCFTMLMSFEVNQPIIRFFLPPEYIPKSERPANVTFFMSLMGVMKGFLLPASIAAGIKVMKHFYTKEHHNLLLQKENAQSQLQLLTAQVHPHFLFNTLNNIFSKAQKESPTSSRMIMGLSDMLRYILYEGQKPLVPLKQELQMIKEYINLEKIRYGNKLDLYIEMPQHMDGFYIAPLLLLPFVENCFKHGASNMLQNPWINLAVELEGEKLVMKLMNGKAPGTEVQQEPGIGIANVRQRLHLLYKDKHLLQLTEDQEVFIVDLQLDLISTGIDEQLNINSKALSTAEYAS